LHQQPVLLKKYSHKSFPVADKFSKTHICPPLYPELQIDEIDYVCDILIKAEKEVR
jgi:dTDP-4-amino-4,6-dideoxygalactose transaminase